VGIVDLELDTTDRCRHAPDWVYLLDDPATYVGKSLGARVIQFISVVMVLPVILILSLQGILKPDAVGTLIGALVGYLLSGIASYDSRKPDAG